MGKATEPKRKGKAPAVAVSLTILPGATETEALAIASRKRALVANSDEPIVNPFAAAHGDFREVEFIEKPGSARKTRHLKNVGATIVDRWFLAGGTGFEDPQRRAVDHCRMLWHNAATTRSVVANLERSGGRRESTGPGFSQQEALTELALFKSRLPREHWEIFENVVRWEEPVGKAGSRFARNDAQSAEAARLIVGFCASLVAMWCRF